jgi:hypothetical protein
MQQGSSGRGSELLSKRGRTGENVLQYIFGSEAVGDG